MVLGSLVRYNESSVYSQTSMYRYGCFGAKLSVHRIIGTYRSFINHNAGQNLILAGIMQILGRPKSGSLMYVLARVTLILLVWLSNIHCMLLRWTYAWCMYMLKKKSNSQRLGWNSLFNPGQINSADRN